MFLKWSKRIGLSLLCLIVGLLLIEASYQFIATKIGERKCPLLGQMVNIGGFV